ncbi:hypothetical protein WAX46_11540 [Bacillus sp. FJAT-53060]|uniref:hypothetical protein n=1 Tax=Bacillus sp. FJAT-53060 TaxID=3127666 RepID=UPI003013B1BD
MKKRVSYPINIKGRGHSNGVRRLHTSYAYQKVTAIADGSKYVDIPLFSANISIIFLGPMPLSTAIGGASMSHAVQNKVCFHSFNFEMRSLHQLYDHPKSPTKANGSIQLI